jgi:hypothetical protein
MTEPNCSALFELVPELNSFYVDSDVCQIASREPFFTNLLMERLQELAGHLDIMRVNNFLLKEEVRFYEERDSEEAKV